MGDIHHVTAIAGKPSVNLDFHTRTLGLRSVKQNMLALADMLAQPDLAPQTRGESWYPDSFLARVQESSRAFRSLGGNVVKRISGHRARHQRRRDRPSTRGVGRPPSSRTGRGGRQGARRERLGVLVSKRIARPGVDLSISESPNTKESEDVQLP